MLNFFRHAAAGLGFLLVGLTPFVNAQTNPYEGEIRAFEAQDARGWPPANSIVFIGSSTINRWDGLAAAFPNYHVLNRGFGGSQTSDALFFVDRIATPYRPPLVVFYEGDNDLAGGKSIDQIFADTTNFFARVQIKSPNTQILYVSVKPSPSRASLMPAMAALNAKVREFTDGNPKLHYADIHTPMLNTSGQPRPELFVSDNLHMSASGYALWTSILGPVVDGIAAAYPIPVAKGRSGSILIDFGAADAQAGVGGTLPVAWNNVTSQGTSNTGALANVVNTAGVATGVGLQMVSRFNGANENGATTSTLFPATATRDSLYGNTETFGGSSNVTPIFKLTGLNTAAAYKVTFYASRAGVGDNRETRYTATGSSTAVASLNPANNIDQVAAIPSLAPDENGDITIALTPGPANNNANHFTYLGVLRLETLGAGGAAFLFDFGAGGSPTPSQPGTITTAWNNVTPEIGATDTGALPDLLATNGAPTGVRLQMTSRFNAANANGTSANAEFPASATQDSLFGNTELFGGLANITPKFSLQNLDADAEYELTFHAARAGVGDNRETRYAVAGETAAFADLNASANVDAVAIVGGIRPDAEGKLAISLAPGPNNNNANHFTYLGLLRVNWSTAKAPAPISLSSPARAAGKLRFSIQGAAGMTYILQTSPDLATWAEAARFEMPANTADIEIPEPPTNSFFRLLQ